VKDCWVPKMNGEEWFNHMSLWFFIKHDYFESPTKGTLWQAHCAKAPYFKQDLLAWKDLFKKVVAIDFFCHNNNSWTMWWLTSMWGLTILYVGMFEFVKHWLYIMDSREVEPFSYMLIVDWFHVIDYVTLEIIIRHSRNKFSE
jgi:hypothetical protein